MKTIEYEEVNFTDEQRKELIRLMLGVTFVETETKFDMQYWASKGDTHFGTPSIPATQMKNECGTCACYMGHSPLFCESPPRQQEAWMDYKKRIFGIIISSQASLFMFSQRWSNSWQEAVARTYIILTKGMPKDWKEDIKKYRKPSDLIIMNYALEYGVTIDEVYDRACELTV